MLRSIGLPELVVIFIIGVTLYWFFGRR